MNHCLDCGAALTGRGKSVRCRSCASKEWASRRGRWGSNANPPEMMTLECLHCGAAFSRLAKVVRYSGARYCGQACSRSAQRRPLSERFRERVRKTESCWEWTGSRLLSGYGAIRFGAATLLAHRVAYELHKGPIPEGLQIDHLCRVRHCVNPDHLEAVTQEVNLKRGMAPNFIKWRLKHGLPV